MKILRNNKGFTLLELMLSIFVGTIVLSILMQMLMMSLEAKQKLDIDDRLKNESYYIGEQIQWNAFEMQAQSVSFSESATQIIISFNHDYDITIDPDTHQITQDTSGAFTEVLIFNKDNETILYDVTQIHSSSVHVLTGTVFEVIPIDSSCDPATTSCTNVVLSITLVITIELNDGTTITSQTFVTTIII